MSRRQAPLTKRAFGVLLGAVLTAASFASAFTAATPTAAAGANETRGGFVTQVGQALCLVANNGAAQKFSDVPPSDPNFGYIMSASAEGWISGFPNGTFGPNGTLTREQMVKVEVVALGLTSQAAALSGQKPNYSDADSIGRWAWGYVNEASDIGIVHGFTDGAFEPTETFTTAEATDALSELTAYLAAHDQPTVTAVTPGSGAAGDTVSVSGSGFCGASGVAFGSAPAASFVVNSTSSLTAVAPSGSGTVDLTVTTAKGTSATGSPDQFAYSGPPTPASNGGTPPRITYYNVNLVASLPDIKVAAATPIGSVLLPTTVQATLSNGATESLAVTWDDGTPAYNGDGAGTYAFTGTLTLPNNVSNPDNLTAAENVVVQAGSPDSGHSNLSPATQHATAGSGNLTLTAQVADQYGNPISGLGASDFAFSSSDAKVGAMKPVSVTETATKGTYTIVLTDTDANGGAPQTLSGSVQGVALNQVQATVAPAAPTISIVSPLQATPVAAGASEPVTFSVQDAYQNPVPGAMIAFGATGSLNSADITPIILSTGPNGQVTTAYTDTQAGDSGTVTGTVYGTVYGPTAQSAPLTIVAQMPDAGHSSVNPPTQTVTAGSGNVSLTVVVGDVYGNALSGLGVTDFHITSDDPGAGTLTPSVIETSPAGTYTLTLTDTDANHGSPQTLSVTVDAVPIGDAQVTVNPAAATGISVASPTAPTDVTVGHGEDVTFLVMDAYKNPVPGTQVDFGTNGSLDAALLGVANAVSGSDGEATVTYTDTTANDAGQVTGTLDGTSTSVASPTLTIVAETTPDGAKSSLSADPSTVQAAPGDVTLTAQVADSYGNAITGLVPSNFAVSSSDMAANPLTAVSVTETSTPGTYTIVLTDSDTNAGSPQTITITVGGIPLPTTQVTVTPAAAAGIAVAAPTGATTVTAGTGQNVTFKVTDQYQNPVPGETVDFSVNGTLDSHGLSAISGKTDQSGEVSVGYLDTKAGDAGPITGSVDGTSITANSPILTVVAGDVDAAHSYVTPSNQTAKAGAGNVSLTTVIGDVYGNPVGVLTLSDFQVTSSDPNVGTMTPVSVTQTSPGTYALDLTDTDVYGGAPQTLTVSASAVQIGTPQVTVTAADPHSMSVLAPTAPENVVAGQPADVTFGVYDVYGNPVPNATVDVAVGTPGTLNPADLTGGAQTGANGQVTVVYLDTKAGDSGAITGTVNATSIAAQSPVLTVVPAAPKSGGGFSHVTGPSSATAGPSDVTLTVKVADRYGNAVTGLGASAFTFSSSVVGNITPNSVTETATKGTYSVVLTDTKAGTQTLATTVETVALNSLQITVNPAEAADISVVSPGIAQTLTAGGSLTVTFKVADAYGNLVADGTTIDFGVTPSLQVPGLSASNGTTAGGQVSVQYTDTTANDSGQVTGTIPGGATAMSPVVTVVAQTTASTAKSTVSPANQTVQAGPSDVTLTVTVEDQYGNAISGLGQSDFTVTSSDGKVGTVNPDSVAETSPGSGIYTVVLTDEDANGGAAQNLTVNVDAQPLTPVQVTVTPALASQIALVSPVGDVKLTAGNMQTVTFKVTDNYGNPVPGTKVDFDNTGTLTDGTFLPGTYAVTDQSGLASVSFRDYVAFTTSGTPEAGTVTGRIDGTSTQAQTGTISIVPGLPYYDGTVDYSHVTPSTQTVTAGSTFSLTVQVLDRFQNPVVGLTSSSFTVATNDTKAGALTTVSVSPLATAGSYTVALKDTDAHAQTLSTTVEGVALNNVTLTVTPAEAYSIAVSSMSPSGTPPINVTGQQETVTFLVTDVWGNPVPNVVVTFGTTGSLPAGELTAANGTTGIDGTVSVTFPQYPAAVPPFTSDTGTVTGKATVYTTTGQAKTQTAQSPELQWGPLF